MKQAMFIVGGILLGGGVIVLMALALHDVKVLHSPSELCARAGGVWVAPKYSRSVCLSKDSVIEVERGRNAR